MDFKTEATVLAAKALVEAQLVMLVIAAEDKGDDMGYEENRRIVLLAADKAWKHVCGQWHVIESQALETAIMLGFRQAVEERQGMDVSDADDASNRVVREFVESFKPSNLIQQH